MTFSGIGERKTKKFASKEMCEVERFPIGFWNYTTGQLRGKDVQDWHAPGQMKLYCVEP